MSPVRRRRRKGLANLRSRRSRIALAAVGTVLLLGALWCAWTSWRVYSELSRAQEQALILKAALARGDVPTAEQAGRELDEAGSSAARSTEGVAWSVLEVMPLAGDDAEGLSVVAQEIEELSAEAIPPLIDVAGDLNARTFAPSDHEFPLGMITGLEKPAIRSHDAFVASADNLQNVDSSGFFSPLREAFDDLRDQVVESAAILDTAERASKLMPQLLGHDGPRDYLLVFQNNAELRATGGLPGTMSVIHAEGGRVDITRQETAGPMGVLDEPVVSLTAAEKRLYDTKLGTIFMDANFTPDFPRAAEIWRARWQLETRTDIDGVFVVDPVAMSYLLEATGPIQVEGRSLTADNIVGEVEHVAYLRHQDQVSQDDFFNAVADETFEVFADGRGDQVGLVQGLIRGVEEARIRAHFFAADEQQLVADTAIAGELTDDETTPRVGVYFNDGTGAKMSYFLDYQVEVTSASCEGGHQKLVGGLHITSDTPANVLQMPESVTGRLRHENRRKGHQLVVADLFSPMGGTIGQLKFGAEELKDPLVDRYLGRQVISVGVPLRPGQTRTITWSMTTGPGQIDPVQVSVTPGSHAENESSTAPTTC